MPMSDYKQWVHGKAAPTTGVDIGHSGSEYSEDEIYAGYSNPNLGGTNSFGLHVVINEVFNTLTSANIWVVSGTATTPTTQVIGRYFALADLAAGKHYFIPCPKKLAAYYRGYFEVNGSNPSTGQVCMWFGPDCDGTE